MTEEILINFTPQETRVAVMQQGVVQELHIERTASRGLVGNVYLGRICRILPGMQSAFVEVGLDRTAFLHVADIWQPREMTTERPIEKILSDAQSIIVQVVKDPIGTKGARLSTQISIAGRMLVYLPQEKHIGISQRIEVEAERESLRARITALVQPEEPGGFIVRTMAENASDQESATDIAYLRKTWRDIRDKARVSGPPTVLYQELSLAQRVLRDFVNPETSKITIDSRENFQKLSAFAEEYTPAVLPLLDHYTGQRPLFDLHGVEDEIQKALARRVDLKSGGYLIIEQTEAMTTTILCEAARIAGNIPPHATDKPFAFKKWKSFDADLYQDVCTKALDAIQLGAIPNLVGYDITPKAVSASLANIAAASLDKYIKIEEEDFFYLEGMEGVTMIFNPPYDARLRENDVLLMHSHIGDKLKTLLPK